MKKLLFAIVLLMGVSAIYATENNMQTNSLTQTQAETEVYYDGYAWENVSDSYAGKAGDSISVYWTSDGLWVNGEQYSESNIHKISGNFAMRVNGKTIWCNRFITYKSINYYFRM